MPNSYPDTSRDRDRWILSRRAARQEFDPRRPVASFVEEERSESGEVLPVATVFLTNRECPWRCVMCDLWQNTLTESVPAGAIPEQIDQALAEIEAVSHSAHSGTVLSELPLPRSERGRGSGRGGARVDKARLSELNGPPLPGPLLPRREEREFIARHPEALAGSTPSHFPRHIKLYNSGSFFDPRAIPRDDHAAIAQRLRRFERIIVECHPSLVGAEVLRFRDRLAGRLEVAMGLETAHPVVLEKLNKRMTLDDFKRAAEFLLQNEIPLRVFILVRPPFLPDEAEAQHWVERSIDFALDSGASVLSLIPTRGGNGAMEALAALGQFVPPRLANLEAAVEYGIGLRRGHVFADLWDLEKFSQCAACCAARRLRLQRMNLGQHVEPPVQCDACGAPAHLDTAISARPACSLSSSEEERAGERRPD